MLVILQVNNYAYDIALAIPRGPGYKPKREAGEPDCVMRTQALDFPLVFRQFRVQLCVHIHILLRNIMVRVQW